jgi:hypothetical protein
MSKQAETTRETFATIGDADLECAVGATGESIAGAVGRYVTNVGAQTGKGLLLGAGIGAVYGATVMRRRLPARGGVGVAAATGGYWVGVVGGAVGLGYGLLGGGLKSKPT